MIETRESVVESAARRINQANRIVALTGAGISTPSGIPDFRSVESGLWDSANPFVVASIWGFRLHPKAFYDWIYPLAEVVIHAQPNPAHQALAQLERIGKLDCVITQNIDLLHQKAGNQTVYELHGHLRTVTCMKCKNSFDANLYIEQFLRDRKVPICECGKKGVLKPDVILFGEALPETVYRQAEQAALNCDLMIVVGSSLNVAPANQLPTLARQAGAGIMTVNLESIALDGIADIVIKGNAAEILPEIVKKL